MNNLFLSINLLVLLFLFTRCGLDDLDFGKLSDKVNMNPEFVAPVAKANVTVWDLVQSANEKNNDLIIKDPNGLLKIMYKKDNIFKYNVREFLNFPVNQSFSSGDKALGEISPGDISFSRSVTLNDLGNSLGGAIAGLKVFDGKKVPFPQYTYNGTNVGYGLLMINDFSSITVSKGSLEIVIENELMVPVTIVGSLFDIQNNTKIADFTFTDIAPGKISTRSVNLEGIKLSNRVEFRMLTFDTPGSKLNLVNINMNDYFKMSFNMKDIKISQGNVLVKSQSLDGFNGAFGFVFPDAGVKAFMAELKKGTLTIKTKNTSKLTGTINVTLGEIRKNGIPIKVSVPLNWNLTVVDLSDANINFASDPSVPYNRIPYSYSVALNASDGYVDYTSTDVIDLEITLNNLDFKSIQGDFGKRSIQIDPGVFDMDVDMFNKLEGGFKLSNPELKLNIQNSIGVPASVNLDFIAANKAGQTVSLNPPVFAIPVPANINAGTAVGNVIFNKDNSRIVDLIALPPTGKISYSGKVDFNPANQAITAQNPNFLDLDAMFDIGVALELPLELQVKNLTFKDTTAVTGNNFDKMESAEMQINAKNGLPLDVNMQLCFIDTISKMQYGVSKVSKILAAAQVSNLGVITPTESVQTFTLDKIEIENLRKSNGVVFSGIVSSPALGEKVAPILSDSKVELKVIIKSKVNL